jgi:hypothetical protein
MKNSARHGPALHATAAEPTLSLLRVSALERLVGAGVVLAALWVLVLSVLS